MPQAVADPQKPVPFDDVPGPTILKQIAKFWKAVPVVGSEVTASTLQYILSAGKMFGKLLNIHFIINRQEILGILELSNKVKILCIEKKTWNKMYRIAH